MTWELTLHSHGLQTTHVCRSRAKADGKPTRAHAANAEEPRRLRDFPPRLYCRGPTGPLARKSTPGRATWNLKTAGLVEEHRLGMGPGRQGLCEFGV